MEGDAPVSSQPSSQLTSGGGQRTLLDVWPCSRPGIDAAVRTRTFAGRAASAKRRSTAAADGGVDARAPAGAAAAAADAGAPEPLVAVDDPRLEDRVVLDAHALTFLSAPGRGGAHVLNDDSIVVVLSCGASSTTGVADTCAGPPPARGALRLPDTWLRVCAGDVLVLRDAATGGQRVVLEGARAEDRDDGGGCSGTAESRPARLLCVEAEVAGAPRRGTLTAGPQPGVVLFWCGKSAPRPTLVAVGPDLGCSLAGLLSPQHRPMRLTETSAEDVEPGRAAFAPGSHGDGVAGVLPIYVDELFGGAGGTMHGLSRAVVPEAPLCVLVPCVAVELDKDAAQTLKSNVWRFARAPFPGRRGGGFAADPALAAAWARDRLPPPVLQVRCMKVEAFRELCLAQGGPPGPGGPPAPASSAGSPLPAACFERPPGGVMAVFVAGAPCQGLSGANPENKANGYSDPRNCYMLFVADEVARMKPDFVLYEEVPQTLVQPYFQDFLGRLLRAGYQYRVEVAQASLLGAAQSRVRAFVVAARCGLLLPDAPRPTHAPPPPPPGRSAAAHAVTLFSGQPQLAEARSAFSAAPTAAAGGAAAAALAAAELRALHALPPHVSVRSALAGLPLEAPWRPNAQHGREPMDAHLARPFAGDASKYRRVSLDGVSPTILTSEPAPSAANARLHPQADRVLSPLERGRLQTFPPGWRWTARFAHGGAPPGATGSRAGAGALSPLQLSALASWHRQVGNAVPPRVAEAWGRELLRAAAGVRLSDAARGGGAAAAA